MDITVTTNIIKAILDVLKKRQAPITADELSYRTRASESIVLHSLNELKNANVVIENNDSYSLNKRQDEYKLETLL